MNPRLIPSARLARATILRSQSDERLGTLVRHGSDAAFEAIVHRYRRALVGHCLRILGSSADAEEAVQEALVSAHAALVNGSEVRSLGSWLHAIAHNSALRVLRRRVARAECPHDDSDGHASVEAPHILRAELREVLEAVQQLPPRQRDAIVMRELEGRSYAEIATRLGASDGAVRQLLNRARHSMRESLGALIPAEPLLRWLLSAENSSPAKGLLTLSGGSAAAIKLSTAALVSAVSVVTLLPATREPVRQQVAHARVAPRRVLSSSAPPSRPVPSAGTTTSPAHHSFGAYGAAVVTPKRTFISARPVNEGVAQDASKGTKPSATVIATKHGRSANGSGERQAGGSGEPQRSGQSKNSSPGSSGTSMPSSWAAPGGSGGLFESPRMPPAQPQMTNSASPQANDQLIGSAPPGP